MAFNTTLLNLRNMVKAELGWLTGGAARDGEINTIISNTQKWLTSRFDWPHLEALADVAMVAGTRYYALPTTLDFQRPVTVENKYNTSWLQVCYGIEAEELNTRDSDLVLAQDPVAKWQKYGTTLLQFEVWPIPASASTLRFRGRMVLPVLTGDAHTAVLDDLLIAYHVAAKLATSGKLAQKDFLVAQAQNHENNIRNSYPKNDRPCVLGGGSRDDGRKTVSIRIATA